ncbi:MAG: discoidin domain-containing protein, partial [Oscillospiraceae bacterium]|nr:discoidin domain-containing protein [Oscillospiraceae bacterium]
MENNCKRFLSLLLALVMVIGLMPVGHVHAEEETVPLAAQMVTEVEANATYVIYLHDTSKALTNEKGSTNWGTNTLALVACGRIPEAKHMWTLETAEGGYKLKNANGYLTVSRNIAELNETGHVFDFVYYADAGWTIQSVETSEFFNHLGGDSNSIGGWSGDGSKFDLYKVVETPDPYGKLRGLWTKISVDTETVYDAKEGKFEYAWDSDPATHWHSNWQGATDKLTGENTFSGVIDFGQAYVINQFSFTARQDQEGTGIVTQASLYGKAAEEEEWKPIAEHVAFAEDNTTKNFCFEAQSIRYVKFVAEQSNDGWVTVSEFDINNDEQHFTGTVTTAATCTVPGEMTYSCACGYSYTEELPAAGHKWTDATCTTPKTCSVCGETEGEAGGGSHTLGELVEAVPAVHTPTELSAAVAAHYRCTVCDAYLTADTQQQTTLEALTGETPVHSYSEATCTAPAACECGAIEGEALGHQTTTTGAVKPSLCIPGATGTTACSVCGEVFTENTAINELPVAAVLKDNAVVALNNCGYFYNGNSFVHTAADGTAYYVKPRSGNSSNADIGRVSQIPQTTEPFSGITINWNKTDDGAVWLNGNSASIHVWTSAEKPFWDACGSAHGWNAANGTHDLYLFRETGYGTGDVIPGYTQVTSAEGMVNGNYLIAARKGDDAWYVMVPSGSDHAWDHIALFTGMKEITGHTAGEATRENEVAPTCGEDGSYDEVVRCTVCNEELSRETVTVSATGEHTYDGEYDPDCNVCGAEREVKTFTSEKLTGLTGEGSSVDTNEAGVDKSL